MDLAKLKDVLELRRRRLAEYHAARRASTDRPAAEALRLVVELEDDPGGETSRWEIRVEADCKGNGPDAVVWGAIGHVDQPAPELAIRRMVQLVEDHVFASPRAEE